MAEAAVEENPCLVIKFFCHHCKTEISRILEDYTCPTCNSGFIEELNDSPAPDDSEYFSEEDDDGDDGFNHLDAVLNEILTGRNDRSARSTLRSISVGDVTGQQQQRGRRARGHRVPRADTFENAVQEFIVNLTGLGYGAMWTNSHGNGPLYVMGNPGDYAWGREGLDAIVTQLLNQMDVAGPPPLDKDKIKEIPVTVITKSQADAKLQCSVCWENFEFGECVRKLECEHVYHENCIVPWLQLHGTCPICRKSLSSEQEERPAGSTDISALMRGVHRWGGSPTISSSSSSTSSYTPASSTSSTSSSNSSSSHRANPPSDNDMDLDFG